MPAFRVSLVKNSRQSVCGVTTLCPSEAALGENMNATVEPPTRKHAQLRDNVPRNFRSVKPDITRKARSRSSLSHLRVDVPTTSDQLLQFTHVFVPANLFKFPLNVACFAATTHHDKDLPVSGSMWQSFKPRKATVSVNCTKRRKFALFDHFVSISCVDNHQCCHLL